MVAVEVELQAKRIPGMFPPIAQAKGRIDEVEVIVQAFINWV